MILKVTVPEWSKGSVLSTDVVIRVGSNPTGDKNHFKNIVSYKCTNSLCEFATALLL